jgi:hypothetical protein
MDPNANLREQEWFLTRAVIVLNRRQARIDAARLSELRQALYDWIRDGGFEPDWTTAPTARTYYGR